MKRTLLLLAPALLITYLLLADDGKDPDVLWVSIDVTQKYQGDAHLIVGKNGTRVLIDGGAEETGGVLLEYFQKNGIPRLDDAVVTHPHFDHYGGILHLLKNGFPIQRLYFTAPTLAECTTESPWGCKWEDLEALTEAAMKNGTNILPVENLTIIPLGEKSRLEKISHFPKSRCPTTCDLNDTSVVLKLHVGSQTALLAGDINVSMGEWLRLNKAKEIKADILKVPHHGAEGTANNMFFQAVAPALAIVPTPLSLWCTDRSKRIRDVLSSLRAETLVNGIHKNIELRMFESGKRKIKTEKSTWFKNPLHCSDIKNGDKT